MIKEVYHLDLVQIIVMHSDKYTLHLEDRFSCGRIRNADGLSGA